MSRAVMLSSLLAAARAQWSLELLSSSAYPLAVCLDGTMGGYYFSPGVGADASNFVVHTQGGGCAFPLRFCTQHTRTRRRLTPPSSYVTPLRVRLGRRLRVPRQDRPRVVCRVGRGGVPQLGFARVQHRRRRERHAVKLVCAEPNFVELDKGFYKLRT